MFLPGIVSQSADASRRERGSSPEEVLQPPELVGIFIMRFFLMCFLSGSLFTPLITAAPDSPSQELERLVAAAVVYHPMLKAAEQRFRQALARYRGERGFYDPQLVASTGVADKLRGVPGVPNSVAGLEDTSFVEGGIDKAFAPGFYAGMGAAERRRWNAVDGDDVYQTLVGAQLRVPLWRDFGFREQDLTERQLWAFCAAMYSQYVTVFQQLRREVALAYIDLQEAHALLLASESASERVQNLNQEAQELVRLQVVPEYQLNQARLEVSLREEELLGAQEQVRIARVQLTQLTGVELLEELALPTSIFVAWAESSTIDDELQMTDAYARRGVWQEVESLIQASEAGADLAREQLKPAIDLKTSVSYQGESFSDGFGNDALLSDDRFGGAVQLVYSQPLGYRRERASLSAERAATAALREQQQSLELSISARLKANEIAFELGKQRLHISAQAVDAAQATLAAEAERFRLGEGRSRQVLDAEQDLTATVRLQARNAARVLRAETEYAFEGGYPILTLLVPLGTP